MTLPPLARPRFRSAPRGAWMNGPAGLVRWGDDGHLLCQRAEDADGRAMGRGHAASRGPRDRLRPKSAGRRCAYAVAEGAP